VCVCGGETTFTRSPNGRCVLRGAAGVRMCASTSLLVQRAAPQSTATFVSSLARHAYWLRSTTVHGGSLSVGVGQSVQRGASAPLTNHQHTTPGPASHNRTPCVNGTGLPATRFSIPHLYYDLHLPTPPCPAAPPFTHWGILTPTHKCHSCFSKRNGQVWSL
jgi:hypothetical protein